MFIFSFWNICQDFFFLIDNEFWCLPGQGDRKTWFWLVEREIILQIKSKEAEQDASEDSIVEAEKIAYLAKKE